MTGLRMAMVMAVVGWTPAAADVFPYGEVECNQLWVMRNLIMDRAGYCFGSTLGKTLFDNGDCLGKDVTVPPADVAQVKRIQNLEKEIGCKVNTDARSLDLRHLDALRVLRDFPLPDNGASSCNGWLGPELPVYDGYRAGSEIIGRLEGGDSVGFGFISPGEIGAYYIFKHGDWNRALIGWVDMRDVNWRTACISEAG